MSDQSIITYSQTMSIEDAVKRYNLVLEFTKKIMKAGKDYGTIPGTSKPTLLKPGGEKLCTLFGLHPIFELGRSIEDFEKGLFYFQYCCKLYDDRGMMIASALGSCNSKEKKYRYRNIAEKKATALDKLNAISTETKSGHYGDYKVYVVENTEPFDLVNTIDKMAQKRALIAAVLIAANASEYFTQDLEDLDIIDGEFVEAPEKPKPDKTAGSPPPPESPAAKMSYESASAVISSDGKKYGDIDSDTLSHMSRSLAKRINKPDLLSNEREEAQYKFDAIGCILAHRASHPEAA